MDFNTDIGILSYKLTPWTDDDPSKRTNFSPQFSQYLERTLSFQITEKRNKW